MGKRGPSQLQTVFLQKDGGWQCRLGCLLGGVMVDVEAEGWGKTKSDAYNQMRKARREAHRATLEPKADRLPPEVARERKHRWAFGFPWRRRKDGEA